MGKVGTMSIASIPLVERRADGSERTIGYVNELPCANCGAVRRVADMIQDPANGGWHCVFCNGTESRAYKRDMARAARELRKVGRGW
jgi:hypothetical protein